MKKFSKIVLCNTNIQSGIQIMPEKNELHLRKNVVQSFGKSCDHAENMIKLGIETNKRDVSSSTYQLFFKVHD